MKRRLGEIGVERGKRREAEEDSVALMYSSRVSANRRVSSISTIRPEYSIKLDVYKRDL